MAFRRWDTEARSVDGGSGEASEDHQASLFVACDATTDPEDIQRSLWFKEKCMFMEPRDARVTSCRATSSYGEFLERTYYYESVSKSLQGNIEAIDMRLLSGGHRPGRLRRCTNSKCRTVFSGIGGGIFMVCCAFLWFIVCCCMLCFCGVCVFVDGMWWVFRCILCFLWFVVVFVLWYVGVCLSKAVLESFFHGEARVTICWTQGVTHPKKKAGLRVLLNPIASLW